MTYTLSNDFYVYIRQRKNGTLGARLSSRRTQMRKGEVQMLLNVRVPQVLFAAPVLSARVTIPESSARAPVIEADIQTEAKDLLTKALGLDVQLTVKKGR